MEDLSHYDLFTVFTKREAACLAAGVDPKRTFLTPRAEAIYEAMTDSLRYWDTSRFPLTEDTLPPDWVLLPNVLWCAGNDRRRFYEYLTFMDKRPDEILFSRMELQRWCACKGIGFKPSYTFYDFSEKAEQAADTKDLSSRERVSLLNICAALLELVLNPRPNRDSQSAVINEMVENWGDKQGIAKSTLEAKFAEARKSLQASP